MANRVLYVLRLTTEQRRRSRFSQDEGLSALAGYRKCAALTQVVDDEHVPQAVRKERPVSKIGWYTIRFIPKAE